MYNIDDMYFTTKKFYVGKERRLSYIKVEHIQTKVKMLRRLEDGVLPTELKKILIREISEKIHSMGS